VAEAGPRLADGQQPVRGHLGRINWTGAQAVDKKLLHTTPVRVDGRAGLAAGVQGKITWAQVDVALGGPGDPVAEYRAPTKAKALALARAATPHILALG
jgi:hypothetical protein